MFLAETVHVRADVANEVIGLVQPPAAIQDL